MRKILLILFTLFIQNIYANDIKHIFIELEIFGKKHKFLLFSYYFEIDSSISIPVFVVIFFVVFPKRIKNKTELSCNEKR